MSKSERLFELLTLLRSKRYAVTAKQLAETMEVSERTIWRWLLTPKWFSPATADVY